MTMILRLFLLIIAALAINARPRTNCPSLQSIQNSQGYRVENYTVHSTVKTRFACTKVYSHITNMDSEAKELCFTITLPEKAFISSLCMEVGGQKYQGIIEEKSRAEQLYDDARNAKVTVALVESVDGKDQEFKVCTNVKVGSTALFTVEYKQLLIMKLRRVEHRIPIELGQNADHVNVSVEYDEPQGIRTVQSSNGIARVSNGGTGLYTYIQSQNCNSNPNKELVITYEPVIRNSVTTYVANYTFLQFFSPAYSLCLNINFLLVVDVSGSMRYRIETVKDFLYEVLFQLTNEDNFNIILFNGTVTKFSDSLIRYGSATRRRARHFIRNIRAAGGTNINGAVVEAGRQILEAYQSDPHRANLIFLISDGRANLGEQDPIEIDRNFRNVKLKTPVILHTFPVDQSGNDLLLYRLTILNCGSLHHIQTEGLFDELLDVTINKLRRECPLLSNIQFNYPDGSVEDLTITSFPYFFKGQELIVSGRILEGADDVMHMNITGNIRGGRRITWRRSISLRLAHESQNSCLNETMLAYLSVKEKYEEYRLQKIKNDSLKNEIINTSKRYHFVTTLTSLLVSETNNEECACPDECVCNSGCPQGSSSPGTNVVGNQLQSDRDTFLDIFPDTFLDIFPDTFPDTFLDIFPDTFPDTFLDIFPDTFPDTFLDTYRDTVATLSIITPLTPFLNSTIQNVPGGYRHRRFTNFDNLSPLSKDCTTQGEDIPSNWLNVSQCGDTLNSHSVQVRCWIDHTEECRDYWIRSTDCNTGEIEHISSPIQGRGWDQRCSVWYDARQDMLRCGSQLDLLESLFQLDVFLCPFSDELNREYREYLASLYGEFELGDEIACSYDHELGSCMLA